MYVGDVYILAGEHQRINKKAKDFDEVIANETHSGAYDTKVTIS